MRNAILGLCAVLAASWAVTSGADEFTGWNALASTEGWSAGKNPDENTTQRGSRRDASKIRYIVIHQTGSGVVAKGFSDQRAIVDVAREYYRTGYCGHYLVGYDGSVFQFVPDAFTAYHVGVKKELFDKYQAGTSGGCDGSSPNWRCLKPGGTDKAGEPLPAYKSWDAWWGKGNSPWLASPNAQSIGIELLGYAAGAAPKKYSDAFGEVPVNSFTDAQYTALAALVKNLAEKYGIPLKRSRIVTHEDLNPVTRAASTGKFLYDPGPHFDMQRFLALIGGEDDSRGGGSALAAAPAAAAPTAAAATPTPPPTAPPPKPPAPISPADDAIGSAVITTAALRVRAGPTTSDPILSVLPKGTELPVLAKTGNWLEVAFRGVKAFLSGKYATFSPVKPADPAPKKTELTFFSPPLAGWVLGPATVRRTPSPKGEVVASRSASEAIETRAKTAQPVDGTVFYRVRFPDGVTGWVEEPKVEFDWLRYVWHRMRRR